MPTYDYRCNGCGHAFELFQQMSAPVKRVCPKCGKRTLERLIGIGAGVLFKGGGFYETDYRSDSYRKAAEAEAKGAGNGEAGGTTPAADSAAKSPEAAPASAGATSPKDAATPAAASASETPSRSSSRAAASSGAAKPPRSKKPGPRRPR
ncbi:MAG: zinc ribbon domain-containing protein [Phycisphaeraceae bacterium]|nr:zinc ribbon domain-containing protein [Phycisphaeraceae bacterium]